MDRQHLSDYLDSLLPPAAVDDYCPNGLQVEGRAKVHRLVTGVTASQALIDAAVAAGADALLVHHGLFWKGDSGRLTGYRRARVARLIGADAKEVIFTSGATEGNNLAVKGAAEIIIAKQRNGPVGDVRLLWQHDYTRFVNLEHRPYDEFESFSTF